MKWLRRKYKQLVNYLTRDRNQQELPLPMKPREQVGTVEESETEKPTQTEENPFAKKLAAMYALVTISSLQASTSIVVKKIISNQDRYKKVAAVFNMPWEVVAVIHNLEGSLRFDKCLHNGQKVIGNGKKTTWVPKGRGPFATWEDAAIDALGMKKSIMPAKWTVGATLNFLEHYNGLGYRKYHKSVPTPYLWSGTSYYKKGKYVSDGKFDKHAVSSQVGAVPVLQKLSFFKD